MSDATSLNTGIDASVIGTLGDGTGVKIQNTIDTAGSTQYGSTIEVTGIEVPPPLTPYGTSKWGSSITVTGDARSNEGMSVTVSDGERNQGIGVSVSGTSASTNIGMLVNASEGQMYSLGIAAAVSGTVGDGTGVKISNTIDTAASTQYGSTIEVTGVEVPPPLTPYKTLKTGSGIVVTGDAGANTGIYAYVSDGQKDNLGIDVSVSGISGNGSGLNILNSISTTGDVQYGALVIVDGAGSASPMPSLASTKTGISIAVSNTANTNTGLTVTVLDASRNYAIITTQGSSVFNDSQDTSSDFNIKGGSDANLLVVSATNDAVGIGVSPSTKLDVLGDYRFVHDPTAELTSSVSGYGDIVTFGSGSLTAGDLYYLDPSGGWSVANADSTSTSTGMLAFALGTSASDGMLVRGYIINSGFSTTTGDIVYVSTTAGGVTTTAPSGSGDVIRIVGYSIDGTNEIIYFSPDNTWVEI